jgi:hypothetical protein
MREVLLKRENKYVRPALGTFVSYDAVSEQR